MEELNMEVASEFILVAATLMSIKAKMLLPRPQVDALGNEVDPREELVKHLLEYKRYKSVIAELSELEKNRLAKEKRGNVVDELKQLAEINNVETEMQDLDLYKLLRVFEKVVKRYELETNKPIHKVIQYPYSIDEQKVKILEIVNSQKKVSFIELLAETKEKIYLIFNFLSILELLQLRKITISIGEGFNNFWIEPLIEQEESNSEQ
jgi:segregation and condensation protein A